MIRIGNAPTSWGIERAFDPTYPSWSTVLDEVAQAGYDGLELGPLGFLPNEPAQLAKELERRSLSLSGGNVMVALDDPTTRKQILTLADRTCALAAALNAKYFVVIDGIVPEREATAGRHHDAPRLAGVAWHRLVDTVARLGEIAANYGLTAAFHPHAGTRVEFRDEVERLLDETDPALIRLCVDTGHSVYASIDPVELIDAHADRLAYVHLKDVDAAALEGVRRDAVGFWGAYERGVFTVLGKGCVNFAAVRDQLRAISYDGWLTVEQDASPTGESVPLEDAVASLAYLRTVGLADLQTS